jgi:hypothetical protein
MNYSHGTSFGYDQIGGNEYLNMFDNPYMSIPDTMMAQNRASSHYIRPDGQEYSSDGGTPEMLRNQQNAADGAYIPMIQSSSNCVKHYDLTDFIKKSNIGKDMTNVFTNQDNIFYILIIISIIIIVMNINSMKKLNKSLKSIKKKIKEGLQ